MSKIYVYRGLEYRTEWAVRVAISKATGMAFGSPVIGKETEFWQRFGVEVREEAVQPAIVDTEWQQRLAKTQAKAKRSEAVGAIVVEVGGLKFQGDEDSQNRMARAVVSTLARGDNLASVKVNWRLADNSQHEVTVAQLAQALARARAQQDALWPLPEVDDAAA